MTQADLNAMLSDGRRMLSGIGIPISGSICPSVKIVKAHSFFGKCCPKGSFKHFPTGYDYVIKISAYTLGNTRKSVMNTILHELIHTCADCHGHDAQWRAYATRAGKAFGYDIRRCGGDKSSQDIKNLNAGRTYRGRTFKYPRYLVTCPACGREWKYYVKGRVVQTRKAAQCPCGHVGLDLTMFAIPTKKR